MLYKSKIIVYYKDNVEYIHAKRKYNIVKTFGREQTMENTKSNEELVAGLSAVLQKITAEQKGYIAGVISTLEAVADEKAEAGHEA